MYTFVTSFPKRFEKDYGVPMLQSVINKWKPTDFKLVVYLEGYDNDATSLPEADYIEYRHIENIEARNDFIQRNKDKNGSFAEAPYNYRLDAVRFCNKVYAFSDLAFELIDQEYKDWLVWLDADTITKKMFGAEDAAKIMPENVDVVHLGRIDIDYSETGFIAWNLAYHNAASLIVDMRGAYDTDEVLTYREWTDAFIFTRLLKIYEAHGMAVRNLSEGVKGLDMFSNCMLNEHFTHNKGNLKFQKKEEPGLAPDVVSPARYKQLANLIRHYSEGSSTFTVVETGTWNGGRAIEMALAAFENVDQFHYRGFDLFEEATDETDKVEINIKQHNATELVARRLAEFAVKMEEKGKKFTYRLFTGDTKETMKEATFKDVDFAFIDGGHSYDTVNSDYYFLKDVPVVVFDDFYSHEEKEIPEEYQGIIKTFKEIKERNTKVLPSQDVTAFGATVHLAVTWTKEQKDLPEEMSRVPIIVKPKDSMPSDYIKNNIKENVPVIKEFDWIQQYKPVNNHAIIVSGGSIDFEQVRAVKEKHNATVWAVKHSYPRLLKEGIVADYCVILDPRPIDGISTHGFKRKDLFETIDPATKFVIASMTDTSVVEYVMSKTDNVLGFHAITDAVRDLSRKDKFIVDPDLPIPSDTLFISGGTASATRTIGLLELLGIRNIHMFGFDCSVSEEVAEGNEEKDEMGNSKYLKVETGGHHFYTTGELLALAQDLEKMFEKKDLNLNIKFYGKDTLASQVFQQSYYNKNFKVFEGFVKDAA